MKQKNIKVVYKSRSIGGSYTQVPKIQMEGRWLEELGFSIGSTIVVEYGEGSLHIRPMTAEELARASLQRTPQQVLAVFRKREETAGSAEIARSLCLALDGVQDPGNLGTIIRLADWFGIRHVFCSPDTADAYSPKAVQATMGSLARVHLHTAELPALISGLPEGTPVYGTFLDGENLYGKTLTENGLLIMGNEGRGIRDEVGRLVNQRLYIPAYPQERGTSESLNVGVATAIVCAEFRRQAARH